MHSCSKELISKISNPAMSSMPMNDDTDTRFVLGKKNGREGSAVVRKGSRIMMGISGSWNGAVYCKIIDKFAMKLVLKFS